MSKEQLRLNDFRSVGEEQLPDEIPVGYKKTDVGIIPEDWSAVFLGEKTVKVGSGITPTGGIRVYKESGRPFLRSQNIEWGFINLDDIAFIDEQTHQSFIGTEIRESDVLLNITGASIGRSAVADKRVEGGNVNQHVCIIRPQCSVLDSVFLKNFLLSELGQRQIDSFQAGGNRQGLNFNQIRSFVIPLPKLSEQTAIAEVLTDVDNLIESLDNLITKKQAIKKSTMQQLLTGRTRLPGFKGEWKSVTIGSLGSVYGGLSGKNKQDFGEGNAFYVTFLNVLQNIVIDPSQFERVSVLKGEPQNIVRKGDLLFNGTSETPDELAMGAAVCDDFGELYLNSFCFGFRIPNQISWNPLFFAYLFRSCVGREMLRSLSQGATRHNLSKSQFLQLVVCVPNYLEQQAIVSILSDLDAEIDALERQRDKMKQIKQGMMQQLLTGRIRLLDKEAV